MVTNKKSKACSQSYDKRLHAEVVQVKAMLRKGIDRTKLEDLYSRSAINKAVAQYEQEAALRSIKPGASTIRCKGCGYRVTRWDQNYNCVACVCRQSMRGRG